MSERTLVDYTLKGMRPFWRWPVKHADPYSPGVADLSGYVSGAGNVFIECKALDRWPARAETVVKLTKFTDLQKQFLMMRRGFLWLRVERDYLLFHGTDAIKQAGTLPRAELCRQAVAMWTGSVDWHKFTSTIALMRPNG